MPDESATYPQLLRLFSATHRGNGGGDYPQRIRNQTNRNPQFIEAGFVEPTIPDKPRSSKQKYRLTGKVRQVLDKIKGDAK